MDKSLIDRIETFIEQAADSRESLIVEVVDSDSPRLDQLLFIAGGMDQLLREAVGILQSLVPPIQTVTCSPDQIEKVRAMVSDGIVSSMREHDKANPH